MFTKITFPEGLAFEDLKLTRDMTTDDLEFEWGPIAAICAASGVDPRLFEQGPEDNVGRLILAWYREHLTAGGAPNLVAEQILAEVAAEDVAGIAAVQPAPARYQ